MREVKAVPSTDWLLDKFWPSMKQHPAVWIAMALLAGYGGLRLMKTAGAEELQAVRETISTIQGEQKEHARKLDTLQAKIRRSVFEQELRRITSDLFTLERDIEKYRDSGQPIPELYRRQRAELLEQKEIVERRLQAFLAANPSLANDPYL